MGPYLMMITIYSMIYHHMRVHILLEANHVDADVGEDEQTHSMIVISVILLEETVLPSFVICI